MKRLSAIASLTMLVGLVGCLPEKRVAWSPDGHWAAVKGADGLYLADAQGKLSARLVERLTQAAWLPDSKQLVLSRSEPAKDWNDVTAVLGPQRTHQLETLAPQLKQEIMAFTGEWKQFKPQSRQDLTGGETVALLVYVRDKLGEGLAAKLAAQWVDYEKLTAEINLLQVATVGDDGTLKLGRVLARAVDPYTDLRVSPTGRTVAFRGAHTGEDDAKPLYVAPLDRDGGPSLVTPLAAMFPDWTPDGRNLVYAATTAAQPSKPKDLRLGVIARRQVCGDDGALLAEFAEPEELAGIVFQAEVRVRCLRDGRILFAALHVELPCTSQDMPERAGLFAVEPGRLPVVVSLIPRQVEAGLPDAMFLFEPSPDERHICIPGGDGRVALLTLATGQTWDVVPEGAADHLRIEPSWRSADELCVAVVPGPESARKRPEIALAHIVWPQRVAEQRIISTAWPETVVSDFLKRDNAASQTSPPTGD